jgi:AMMECR1 domain-containing protein
MKILIYFIIFLFLIFHQFSAYALSDPALEGWREFSQTAEAKLLTDWLRCRARGILSGNKSGDKLKVSVPQFYGKLGIFVTLKKGNNVRGCYGAFFHSSPDIVEVLSDYLSGALTRDPRYKPLILSELEQTAIIITIASQPRVVDDPDLIDTLRYGIALVCGDGAMTVFVPYELRGVQDLRKYFREKDCQALVFEAVTIR